MRNGSIWTTFSTRGGNAVSEIRVGENESLDNALKRFKRQCATSGVLKEVRKENIMKNQVWEERKNQKKHVEKEILDIN